MPRQRGRTVCDHDANLSEASGLTRPQHVDQLLEVIDSGASFDVLDRMDDVWSRCWRYVGAGGEGSHFRFL